jgi:hypothetical protein
MLAWTDLHIGRAGLVMGSALHGLIWVSSGFSMGCAGLTWASEAWACARLGLFWSRLASPGLGFPAP